jgi:hypothetical protein
VQLAEALFGNPRNDAGGTLFFEFTVNQRIMHLVSRLGYICGLRWQELGIGVSSPQAIRLLSAKPDTDGEHWQIKAMWHADAWYTIAYGQDPTPYRNNPLVTPPARPPYPWRPGVATWGATDALFPNQNSFEFDVDTSSYPAQLTISGALPVNIQPNDGSAPLVPLQASTANTGGSIRPGTYLLAFSVNDNKGPVSNFITAVVPVGTNTNTITVAGIQWQSGAASSIQPYVGTSSMNMHTAASASYTGSSPDGNGNPTEYIFTAISPDGLGLPDINFNQFLVEEWGLVHSGVLGDTVASIDVTGKVLTFSGGWTTNQWAGYVLSLQYRPGVTTQPALNMVVTSNTADALTMPAAGFLAGDVVVLRFKAGHITSNTIGDDNMQNSYYPGGMDINDEIGNLIFILAGTGAGQPPKTVASNTHTVLTITGTWDVTPDATSIFLILDPGLAYSYDTKGVTGDGTISLSTIVSTAANTVKEQALLVSVSTADSGGSTSPWQYQPKREIYIPPQSIVAPPPTVQISASTTLTPNAQNVEADATAGGITVTLPPFLGWIGQDISITKSDATANVVTWQTSSGDTVIGVGTSGTLTAQGQGATITATQA